VSGGHARVNSGGANSYLSIVGDSATDNITTGFLRFYNTTANEIARVSAVSSGTAKTSGSLIFSTGNAAAPTERMRINASGNLGIGTTTPLDRLSVQNTIKARGTIDGATTTISVTLRTDINAIAGLEAGAIDFRRWTGAATNHGTGLITVDQSGAMRFFTDALSTNTFSTSERFRIDSSGNTLQTQPEPAAVDTSAALTVANLRTRIITSTTAAAVTGTLPPGTLMDGLYSAQTDMGYDWSVINTGPNTFTVAAGTFHTVVGNMAVTTNTSGSFRSRRTGANTWVSYRIG
jgi:hypothetical protein